MRKTLLATLVMGLLVSTAANATESFAGERAQKIAQESIIIDTHIDVPWRLINDWEDMTGAAERGDYDYERAKQGGLNAPFMAIYIPSRLEDNGAFALANQLIDMVEAMVYRAPDKYAIAYSADDIQHHFDQGLISLPMGLENGAPIEGDLAKLQHFYDRGVRYITLTHSEDNHISDSSYDDRGRWGGLSPFGKDLVKHMNQLGMLVDVSHISDQAFYDVLEVTQVPVLATHSSARAFTPGWERNMSDEMIQALAENGGVVQVTFGSAFVSAEANQYRAHLQQLSDAINAEYGEGTQAAQAALVKMREANPYPYATYETVLDHFDHIIELVGIDHVGIGSDYDGVGDTLPEGLKDASTYPNLIQGFLDRGYSAQDIDKILHQNTLRVWRAAEAFAQQQ